MGKERKYREFLDNFAEKWFRWLRWALTTAALWAFAEKSGSIFLKIPAHISLLIVFFNAYFALERFYVVVLPNPTKLPRWVFHLLVLLLALSQFIPMFFISEVIRVALK